MNSADSKASNRPFSSALLAEFLQRFPAVRGWRVALSGGADSVALLHALSKLPAANMAPISAIHVNHGLQSDSYRWAEFCEQLCQTCNIPLQTLTATIQRESGESLEMAARRARYTAISAQLQDSEAVLTAHHQNDQAETLLLNLLNGAGATGLAAMPACRPFSQGYLIRPLLKFSHQQLVDYLQAEQQQWIEDPSNQDTVFDRNFLRNEIIPLLETRWPATVKCLARSAHHQRDQVLLNQQQAAEDLKKIADFPSGGILLASLRQFSLVRKKQVLRHWLASSAPQVNPSTEQLTVVLEQVIAASPDAQPQLKIAAAVIRRSGDKLVKTFTVDSKPPQAGMLWQLDQPLKIESLGIRLDPQALLNQFDAMNAATQLVVRFRQGGERFKAAGDAHHRKLKHLFQEWRVPHWKRDSIPLVYWQEQLIAVWGYGCARF